MTIKVYPEISGMGIYRSVFMYKHSCTTISSILILPLILWLNSSYKSCNIPCNIIQYQYHQYWKVVYHQMSSIRFLISSAVRLVPGSTGATKALPQVAESPELVRWFSWLQERSHSCGFISKTSVSNLRVREPGILVWYSASTSRFRFRTRSEASLGRMGAPSGGVSLDNSGLYGSLPSLPPVSYSSAPMSSMFFLSLSFSLCFPFLSIFLGKKPQI